jgi:phospholipase C
MDTTGRIEHVVVLMLENRSFDHLFGFRPGVEGLKGTEFNLLDPSKPESSTNRAFHVTGGANYATESGQGPGHSIAAANDQICNNKNGPSAAFPARNNGFVKNYVLELHNDKVGSPTDDEIAAVMEAFQPNRLPAINALADAFCVCDHWFSEVPGPTQPNRLFMHSATSAGYVHNDWKHIFNQRTIYNNLEDAGKTWATYDFDLNEVRNFSQVNKRTANFKRFDPTFAADAKAGKLPNYSFILPRFNNGAQPANDQHAPNDVRYGDQFIADVYAALVQNADAWKKTVLIITYDEHGGYYDHVVPPSQNVPNPDGINSPLPHDPKWVTPFNFDRLGFRVPAVIASPWVQKGVVDSTQYQHTSVLATLKKLFGLNGFLTKRDESARSFDHLFTALQNPREDYPKELPRVALPPLPSRDDPLHPANQPLDAMQREWIHGLHLMAARSQGAAGALGTAPTSQGNAADFINTLYQTQAGGSGSR